MDAEKHGGPAIGLRMLADSPPAACVRERLLRRPVHQPTRNRSESPGDRDGLPSARAGAVAGRRSGGSGRRDGVAETSSSQSEYTGRKAQSPAAAPGNQTERKTLRLPAGPFRWKRVCKPGDDVISSPGRRPIWHAPTSPPSWSSREFEDAARSGILARGR